MEALWTGFITTYSIYSRFDWNDSNSSQGAANQDRFKFKVQCTLSAERAVGHVEHSTPLLPQPDCCKFRRNNQGSDPDCIAVRHAGGKLGLKSDVAILYTMHSSPTAPPGKVKVSGRRSQTSISIQLVSVKKGGSVCGSCVSSLGAAHGWVLDTMLSVCRWRLWAGIAILMVFNTNVQQKSSQGDKQCSIPECDK